MRKKKKSNKETIRANKLLAQAIARLGTQGAAAKALDTHQSAICDYVNNTGREIPNNVVIKLCNLFNLEYYPEDLKPDEEWGWLYDFIKLYNRKHQRAPAA